LSSFSSRAHALYGMSPTPHAKMPMMPNNILEVKHTNESRRTFYIYCTCVWNSFYLDFALFLTWSKAFCSFHFCFAYQLFKIQTFIEVWSCHLKPLEWINGCQGLPHCI
jgi:hypothetical protein